MTEPNSVKAVLEQLAEAEKQRAEPNLSSKQRRARTVSRLAAVQALYQMELAGEGVETVITEFSNFRFDADIEGEALAEADEAYFADIVRGVIESQRDIDTAIKARLASNWKLERIDATLRALLRSGAWELIKHPETPREVVIDEYVELAKAFFDDAGDEDEVADLRASARNGFARWGPPQGRQREGQRARSPDRVPTEQMNAEPRLIFG